MTSSFSQATNRRPAHGALWRMSPVRKGTESDRLQTLEDTPPPPLIWGSCQFRDTPPQTLGKESAKGGRLADAAYSENVQLSVQPARAPPTHVRTHTHTHLLFKAPRPQHSPSQRHSDSAPCGEYVHVCSPDRLHLGQRVGFCLKHVRLGATAQISAPHRRDP